MDRIAAKDLPKLFEGAAEIFAEKKEELCALDARMGDGDLGLTMNKGYAALPGLIRDNLDEEDIGKNSDESGDEDGLSGAVHHGNADGRRYDGRRKAVKGEDFHGSGGADRLSERIYGGHP